MDAGDISTHLVADWLPFLPSSVSSSVCGWPPILVSSEESKSGSFLTMRTEAGRTERQWKAVMSWMLGVAGARHALENLGYRWIAPLSAFYSKANEPVDLSRWHERYPPTVLSIDSDPDSNSRLRPDFIAIKPISSGGDIEWAVVEAKGTTRQLRNMHRCRRDWRDQVRNVRVICQGRSVGVRRHIVIATRVNPNASRPRTRRLQIRVWNSSQGGSESLPLVAAPEIASAHLYGLARTLGLMHTARELAVAGFDRAQNWRTYGDNPPEAMGHRHRLIDAGPQSQDEFVATDEPRSLATDTGPIVPHLEQETKELLDGLVEAGTGSRAVDVLRAADCRLDAKRKEHSERARGRSRALSVGIRLEFPEGFLRS